MEEIWKAIPDYEGYYEVSNTGKIRSVTRTIIYKNGAVHNFIGKELKQDIEKNQGYYRICLNKNGIKKTFKVHRLVALAFIPNPDNLPFVNHKDENKLNNNVDNLEWCTAEYNINYGTRTERQSLSTTNHQVVMCDKDTHEPIKEFFNSRVAAEYFNGNTSNILKVISGRGNSAYGYWWKYKE